MKKTCFARTILGDSLARRTITPKAREELMKEAEPIFIAYEKLNMGNLILMRIPPPLAGQAVFDAIPFGHDTGRNPLERITGQCRVVMGQETLQDVTAVNMMESPYRHNISDDGEAFLDEWVPPERTPKELEERAKREELAAKTDKFIGNVITAMA